MRKRSLIIGASGAIGSAVTRELVDNGWSVALHYHSNVKKMEDLEGVVPSDQWIGMYQADLSHPDGISSFLKELESEWDAVVFAGGHAWNGLFQDMTVEEMDRLYYAHVQSVWRIAKHVLPAMIEKKSGNMVVISSIFGEEGASTEVAYSSVKGAQLSFVKGLAKEVAPSGIRVNAVTPGWIETKMNAHLTDEDTGLLEEEIPLGRAGTPEEVAGAVHFLLSAQAGYITGQTIKVNGGWS
ncbi:SDR family oxidoreductase [Halobacillus litoralis]|uniref:elongation factor P 5-aminopentanone reductase n=1 Tax=Halobacillus litoralis TaxID=45668 RepID=UPI001CD2FF81|nr:SDR family oxidoreductase [Halobacillus litoralis]MCA0969073.1 SDR family oxidoreductase [Halobacillus litoralis]